MEYDAVLRELADDPADYLRQAGQVLLTRQGREHAFSLRESPGIGVVVDDSYDSSIRAVPLFRYVQQHLLDLPRLASQIVRTFDRVSSTRPTRYIESSAEVTTGDNGVVWQQTLTSFREYLGEQEVGTTRLIQLMAGAGQGKTVLLEQLARDTASSYQPDPYPAPFLLTVDLLGRYVGTVDDAIAGSLNNTFMFPGLTQRDVALCVRHRWMVLALDGFDELVARVGARDAFIRITELLDQLGSSGTVILSARESFFELYQISAAIRSYLQPRAGSYNTSAIRLLPWTREQGRSVFVALESRAPDDDLRDLLTAFGNDEDIVLQPFFLTRLARLWMQGERFADVSEKTDAHWRTRYIIETFIDRESRYKWTDRDKRPLLPLDGHTRLLAGIAEEMWRSGAFRLGEEELRIASQIALASSDLPAMVMEAIAERVPTHAALITRERGYAFLHDRFFHYYLAKRLTDVLITNAEASCRAILGARELAPEIVEWTDWLLASAQGPRQSAVLHLLAILRTTPTDKLVELNAALLLGALVADQPDSYVIVGLAFSGGALRGKHYARQRFHKCQFWQLDLSDSHFEDCEFVTCEFGDLLLNGQSSFAGSQLRDCAVRSLELPGDRGVYDPELVKRKLEELGADFASSAREERQAAFASRIASDTADAVSRVVRRAQQSCDLSLDEIEATGADGRTLTRIGIEAGVLREIDKNTSGPRRSFYRFQVDRQALLRGQAERTGDSRIDAFWDALAKRYPSRG